jgi:hypothetical protein
MYAVLSQKELHDNLVVLLPVDPDLACQPAAFAESQPLIERPRGRVRCPDLNNELAIAGIAGKGLSHPEELTSHPTTAPVGEKKRAELSHVPHGMDRRRPEIQTLEPENLARIAYGDVNCFARREGAQVIPLLLDSPWLVDSGMNTLRGDRPPYRRDPFRIIGHGPANSHRASGSTTSTIRFASTLRNTCFVPLGQRISTSGTTSNSLSPK